MQISSLQSVVLIPDNLEDALQAGINQCLAEKIYIIVDQNTKQHCLPLIANFRSIKDAKVYEIEAGEDKKTVESVVGVWRFLSQNGANRKSLVINLGGGMLCDLSGFAASTFKRGLNFINIPTTLLAQVDASIGGKLGFNFEGLKNEIGLFKTPAVVIIDPIFLKTLDHQNFIAGYAEMIKHALIYSSSHWKKLKLYDLNSSGIDKIQLKNLISKSIFIKNDFVQNDPKEKNIRKALNFGHTIGHAIESLLMEAQRPVLHGVAVAYGLIGEAYLAHRKMGLSGNELEDICNYLVSVFGKPDISVDNYERLYELMQHDKKNDQDRINFTLITEIGTVSVNENCSKNEIFEALTFINEY